jgi:uncharacterized protein
LGRKPLIAAVADERGEHRSVVLTLHRTVFGGDSVFLVRLCPDLFRAPIAVLSGAPSDIPEDWMLSNEAIRDACDRVNGFAGSQRMLGHFIFVPGQPGWLDAIDHGIEALKPAGWKGYTIGDNTHKEISRYPWYMDDENLTYRGYEKFDKAGIRIVAVHKGLFPPSDEEHFPRLTSYARVDDVGKAAKDWPQLNFLIYHAGYRYTGDGNPALATKQFDATGRMDWVSDLAEVPAKYGVGNVYADLGASFAAICLSQPRGAAAMLGILIKGLGADHVLWGTDSLWFGSPQWQIEAFRRLEIPDDMQRQHGFAALGPADGAVKEAILGRNGARGRAARRRRLASRPAGLDARRVSGGRAQPQPPRLRLRAPLHGLISPEPSREMSKQNRCYRSNGALLDTSIVIRLFTTPKFVDRAKNSIVRQE